MNTINDDRVLDAQDMAEEVALARDEAIATDIDIALEQVQKQATGATNPRTFSDVINEWTETCLDANRQAGLSGDVTALTTVLRLGTLGQRLIFEANAIGMTDATAQAIRISRG